MKRHVQTVLAEDMFKVLKITAIEEHLPVSVVVRKAIVAYLSQTPKVKGVVEYGEETGKTH